MAKGKIELTVRLFGEASTFAIELFVTEQRSFCGACLWIGGSRLGAPELWGTPGALATGLAAFLEQRAKRNDASLFVESPQSLLDRLEKALFGSSGTLADASRDSARYGAFLFSPNLCESLDDYLIVVVASGDRERVLARSYIDEKIFEATVSSASFDVVMRSAEQTLLELEEKRLGAGQ